MPVKRFGDWDKVKARLENNPGARLAKAIRQATIQNALLLVREIKRGILAQAPGGVPFTPLAESTVERKGSSKALIDTGFLLNSITQRILADHAFVGLLRGTVNKGRRGHGEHQRRWNMARPSPCRAQPSSSRRALSCIPRWRNTATKSRTTIAEPSAQPSMARSGDTPCLPSYLRRAASGFWIRLCW